MPEHFTIFSDFIQNHFYFHNIQQIHYLQNKLINDIMILLPEYIVYLLTTLFSANAAIIIFKIFLGDTV